MKLRTRLIVAFIIIILVSALLYGILFFTGFMDGSPGSTQDLIDYLISGVFLMGFLGAMLIFWMYHPVIKNIRTLLSAAENIKEGNLDFVIEMKGDDEIAELGRAFDAMRVRLKEDAQVKVEYENDQKMLISNIAHDLKTPLTTIRGYSEGLIDGVANTPERQEAYIRTIHNKADEMNTLLNELTMYSQLDTNRIPYNFVLLNVRDYFTDCATDLAMELKSRDTDLSFDCRVDGIVQMIADPEQLSRSIQNIIANSVKYRGEEPLRIHFRVSDVGDFIQVDIEDNGRGIAAADLPHIFDRLYRADASRNSHVRGSGIGLSIVKKIVEDMGGQVWATSTERIGTSIHFVLRKYDTQKEGRYEQDTDRGRRRGNR